MRFPQTFCVVLTLAGQSIAQSTPAPVDVAAQAFGVVRADGHLGAVGPHYRVRFERENVEFTPALGRAADVPRRVAVALAAVRRGAETKWFRDPGTSPLVTTVEDGVELSHEGGTLIERWTPRRDGVEVSFLFEEPVDGDGDLVVSLSLDTTLPTADTPWLGDGLELVAPDVGGVTIGAVTGVDADGRRSAGSLRILDGHLELSLPARFVQTARYPLLLDPLIGTRFVVGGTAPDSLEPVVAYDDASDVWLVVFQTRFSVGVSDVFGLRVSATGNLVGSPLLISGASVGLRENAAVGATAQVGMFLVAWQESDFLGVPSDIRARIVRGADGAMGGIFRAASGADSETDPDIATTSGNRTVLVWGSRGSVNGAFARRITMPSTIGTPLPGPAILLGNSTVDARPAVSQNGGAPGRYAITWRSGASEIRAQLVDDAANLVGGQLVVTSGGNPVNRPDVDGDGMEFLVVFDRAESSTGLPPRDVVGRKIRYDGTNLVTASGLLTLATEPGADEFEPAVAFLGPKYVLLWSDGVGDLDYDIGIRTLRTDDCTACGLRYTRTALVRTRQSAPQVASLLAAGNPSDACLLVWNDADTQPPFQGTVIAERFEAHGGLPPVVVSPGCAGGGDGVAIGDFVFGADNFSFSVKRADPSTLAFALAIGFPGPPISCGSCDFLTPVVQFIVPATIGSTGASASFAHRPSCDPLFLGLVLDFQWVAVGTTTGPCPLVSGIAASDRVRVTLAP